MWLVVLLTILSLWGVSSTRWNKLMSSSIKEQTYNPKYTITDTCELFSSLLNGFPKTNHSYFLANLAPKVAGGMYFIDAYTFDRERCRFQPPVKKRVVTWMHFTDSKYFFLQMNIVNFMFADLYTLWIAIWVNKIQIINDVFICLWVCVFTVFNVKRNFFFQYDT